MTTKDIKQFLLRLPASELDAIRQAAERENLPVTYYIRLTLKKEVEK
jgi:hypothetical protein